MTGGTTSWPRHTKQGKALTENMVFQPARRSSLLATSILSQRLSHLYSQRWPFFPILMFVGFSTFIVVSFTLTALATVLVFSGAIILGAALILLAVISIVFGFAVFLTVSGFLVYIAYRLAFHVKAPGGRGIGAWRTETAMRFGLVDVRGMRDALASSETKPADGKVTTE